MRSDSRRTGPRPDVKLRFVDSAIVVVDKPAALTTVRHAAEVEEAGRRAQKFLPPTLVDILPDYLPAKERSGASAPRCPSPRQRKRPGWFVLARTAAVQADHQACSSASSPFHPARVSRVSARPGQERTNRNSSGARSGRWPTRQRLYWRRSKGNYEYPVLSSNDWALSRLFHASSKRAARIRYAYISASAVRPCAASASMTAPSTASRSLTRAEYAAAAVARGDLRIRSSRDGAKDALAGQTAQRHGRCSAEVPASRRA